MGSVEWTHEGLSSLARLDAWRVSQSWEPLSIELMSAIDGYFARWDPGEPPTFIPGRPVELDDRLADLRMATVTVRSKAFRVYFRYLKASGGFEVLRILHPHAK